MRSCGECSLCCKLPAVGSLGKPLWEWCKHCSTRMACDIYEDRPNDCRKYDCLWLANPAFPEELWPKRSKVVFEPLKLSRTVLVLVDPDCPAAWQKKQVLLAIDKLLTEGVSVVITQKRQATIFILAQGRIAEELQRDLLREQEAQLEGMHC